MRINVVFTEIFGVQWPYTERWHLTKALFQVVVARSCQSIYAVNLLNLSSHLPQGL